MNVLTEIRTHRLANGTNRPILLGSEPDAPLQPLFYPNLFITNEYKPDDEGTISNALHALKCLYAWGVQEDIDFQSLILDLKFLTATELQNMEDAIGLKYPYLLKQAERSLERRSGVASNLLAFGAPETTLFATLKSRMGFVKAYFKWLAGQGIAQLPKTKQREAEEDRDKWLKWFKGRKYDGDPPRVVYPLDNKALDLLHSLIEPGSPDNPWSPETQLRNYIIVKIYLSTGFRLSELLALYVTDIPAGKNVINLHKRVNDPKDTRIPKARVKTAARTRKITPKVRQMINEYVQHDRRIHKISRKHPFLFVSSQDGSPLSNKSVGNVITSLRKNNLLKNMNPHRLRHTNAHQEVLEQIRKGTPPELIVGFLREDMGWSKFSDMPAWYLQLLRDEGVQAQITKMEERFEGEGE